MTKHVDINYYQSQITSVELEDQLLICLMKLRCNFSLMDLGFRFGLSATSISNIFITILYTLHAILYDSLILSNLPYREKCSASLPECFLDFPNCRFIWDCTEIAIDRPRNLTQQRATYSHYKSKNTFKILVCVAPNGAIVYCSNAYTGCASDRLIVEKCGIISHLKAGDLILTDKGFLVSDIMPPGVTINMPSFLPPSRQFTSDQCQKNKSISQARIHVERAIDRIKQFSILDNIPHNFRKHSSKIFQVCASLVNMQAPYVMLPCERQTE